MSTGTKAVVLLAAPIAGLVLGVRAARSGNRSGRIAASIAVVMLAVSIYFALVVATPPGCGGC